MQCVCCVLSLNVHSIHTCLNVHVCECIYLPVHQSVSTFACGLVAG